MKHIKSYKGFKRYGTGMTTDVRRDCFGHSYVTVESILVWGEDEDDASSRSPWTSGCISVAECKRAINDYIERAQ